MNNIKRIWIFSAMMWVAGSLGCSMCCGPTDYHYPTIGGKHQRANPTYGRVGSIFSDPFAGGTGVSPDSNLKPPPELRGNDTRDSEGSDTRNSEGSGSRDGLDDDETNEQFEAFRRELEQKERQLERLDPGSDTDGLPDFDEPNFDDLPEDPTDFSDDRSTSLEALKKRIQRIRGR